MTTISRHELTVAVFDRLDTLANLTVFKAEVPSKPPVIDDASGRVGPYAVVYPTGGTPNSDVDLGDSNDDLDWGVQVTVAAGYLEDLMYTVDQVDGLLFRWSPTLAGAHVGRLHPPLGFNSGPARRDEDVSPPRFWLPLLYQLTATT